MSYAHVSTTCTSLFNIVINISSQTTGYRYDYLNDGLMNGTLMYNSSHNTSLMTFITGFTISKYVIE
jgi:hypothetical protein